jgi:Cu/Ag efflux protein CusF
MPFQVSGMTLQLPVAKDAAIVINGQEGKLADLRHGMQVSLQISPDRPTVTRIDASIPGRTIVKAIDAEKKTITVTIGDQEWTAPLAAEVKVLVVGTQEAQLSDLKAGMQVNLNLAVDGDRIVVKAIRARAE